MPRRPWSCTIPCEEARHGGTLRTQREDEAAQGADPTVLALERAALPGDQGQDREQRPGPRHLRRDQEGRTQRGAPRRPSHVRAVRPGRAARGLARRRAEEPDLVLQPGQESRRRRAGEGPEAAAASAARLTRREAEGLADLP